MKLKWAGSMAWRQHLDFLPVPFVKAKTNDEDWFSAGCPSESTSPKESTSDGTEIKAFYEDLVGLTTGENVVQSSQTSVSCRKLQHSPVHQEPDEIRSAAAIITNVTSKSVLNNYLLAAQNGDTKHISSLLKSGIDIDVQDQYKWTALMCAAQSGHSSVVKLLLHKGADKLLINSRGKTALDIAKSCHHRTVIKLLEHTEGVKSGQEKSTNSVKPFYCRICRAEFSDTNEKAHSTSTIHLFNMKLKPKRTLYQISEANRGFKMMLRSGWNEEMGLGKQGQGKKFPVKTILKRDRQGLGCRTKSKPKITHFGANELQAIKRVKNPNREIRAKTMGKRARLKAMKKERQKEVEFRREFYAE